MVTVTQKAKDRLTSLMTEEKLDDSHFLRVGVKGGGCAGIQYYMEFNNQTKEGDEVFEDKGIKIVCDMKSLLYLFGTELDYSDGLNGRGFEWHNPNVERVCGCGISFSI